MSAEAITFESLAVDHDYYCSENNFFSNDEKSVWETWADFYEEYHDADEDQLLIFRWDIHKRENSGRYWMEVFMMIQRKGIFHPHRISLVDERDLPTIMEVLSRHWAKLIRIWNPISGIDVSAITPISNQKEAQP